MSDESGAYQSEDWSKSQRPKDDSPDPTTPDAEDQWWWTGNQWEPVPAGMLSERSSEFSLAVNDSEFPELSRLIQHTGDVDSYLRALGVSENSVAEDSEESAQPFEAEEDTGMDA
ncbi:MAG TPA: hypothetical protein VJ851_09600 [Jatrophihabitans sp.]|nr:hypothetical protein [Jatrophihabitans sp.]